MKLQARPYRDPADLIPMRQLVMTGRQTKIPASYMHPGCLDWDTYYPTDEEANRRNLRLWERWMKTRLGWKLWQVDSIGPERAAQVYGTEVDLAELEEELQTICSRYDLTFPKGFHAEAQLSTAPVDEWLVVRSMGSPTSGRRLWLRLEDVDVVEVVVT